MRILVYGIHYTPDLIGIPKYSGEMCVWLAAKGHQVAMVTGKSFYPEWKSKSPKDNSGFYSEIVEGVKVYRNPMYIPERPSAIKKVIHEFSFALSSIFSFTGCLFKQYDALIVIAPPFHLGLLGLLFAKIKGIPMVYHIQDLQIDIAKDMQMLKGNFLLNWFSAIEKYIFRKVDLITTISDGMRSKIVKKGIDAHKINLFPNWVDTNFIKPLSKNASLQSELGFKTNDFIVLYAGNMGEKQGLEIIIEAAQLLKQYQNMHFVLVGDGSSKDRLMQEAHKQRLVNIHFFPLQPYQKLSRLLAMADVHLVLQKKTASDLVLPSKLTSILSVGGVSIATATKDSYLYQVFEEFQLGILIPPEDASALSDAIVKCFLQEEPTNQYKINSLYFAENFLHKEKILNQFEHTLKQITLK